MPQSLVDDSQFTEFQEVIKKLSKGHKATKSSCWSPNPDQSDPKWSLFIFISLWQVVPCFTASSRDMCYPSASQRRISYLNFVTSDFSIMRRQFSKGETNLWDLVIHLQFPFLFLFSKILTHQVLLRNMTYGKLEFAEKADNQPQSSRK